MNGAYNNQSDYQTGPKKTSKLTKAHLAAKIFKPRTQSDQSTYHSAQKIANDNVGLQFEYSDPYGFGIYPNSVQKQYNNHFSPNAPVAARGKFRGRGDSRAQFTAKRLQFGERPVETTQMAAGQHGPPQFHDKKFKGGLDFTGSER